MAGIQDLFDVLTKIRTAAGNLNKDIDPKDKREETKQDVAQLTLNFKDLKKILSSMTEQDRADLQRELQELFSGQETFAEYNRDVQKLIMSIKNRIDSDIQVEQKIAQNLPAEHKEKGPSTLFETLSTVLQQLAMGSDKAARR
jgi:uncharacterized protein with von Willebrand factor type A (vWA) domain